MPPAFARQEAARHPHNGDIVPGIDRSSRRCRRRFMLATFDMRGNAGNGRQTEEIYQTDFC